MDITTDNPEMFHSKLPHKTSRLLVKFDKWEMYEMVLTPPKVEWLWREHQKYPSLFSDLTRGNLDNFIAAMYAPNTFWTELYEGDTLIGLLYLVNMHQVIDCDCHVLFFDRKTKDKIALCREALRWVFKEFRFHRVSAQVPEIYHATLRLVKGIGFKQEGLRRETLLIGGKWVGEIQFGLLSSEML